MGLLDRFQRGRGIEPAPTMAGAGVGVSVAAPPRRGLPANVDLERLAGGADRICVVDCETTGVYSTDRVVELAIITLALDGTVLETWDTLIHPRRDVGATHIHGLTAEILRDAPTFQDVAGDIALRLHGACLAAHNLPFDHRMIAGEFSRIDVELFPHAGIDTLTATGCRLSLACATHGITLEHAHSALADATATAHLLCYVAEHCQTGAPLDVPVTLARSGRVFPRSAAGPITITEPPHVAALAATLDHSGLEASILAYLELVDRAVADLHLDAHERVELERFAGELGLDDAHRAQAHRRLVSDLIDAALADHVVTADELDVLLRVAAALDVDARVVEQRTRTARAATVAVRLDAGLEAVFTGDDPSRPREDLIHQAQAYGLTVGKNVTKRTDMLVAFDAESASGKAAKARSYGVPILSTAQFAAARPGDLLEAHGSTVEAMKVVTCPDCHATWTVPVRSGVRTSQRCDECTSIPPST